MNDQNLAYATIKSYISIARVVVEYDKDIRFDKIDLKWIAGFKEYLLTMSKKKLNIEL